MGTLFEDYLNLNDVRWPLLHFWNPGVEKCSSFPKRDRHQSEVTTRTELSPFDDEFSWFLMILTNFHDFRWFWCLARVTQCLARVTQCLARYSTVGPVQYSGLGTVTVGSVHWQWAPGQCTRVTTMVRTTHRTHYPGYPPPMHHTVYRYSVVRAVPVASSPGSFWFQRVTNVHRSCHYWCH